MTKGSPPTGSPPQIAVAAKPPNPNMSLRHSSPDTSHCASSTQDDATQHGGYPRSNAADATPPTTAPVTDVPDIEALLADLNRRFRSVTYVATQRDRADIELIKAASLHRIAEALDTIDARQRRTEGSEGRWL